MSRQRAEGHRAGVVHQHVELSEFVDCGGHRGGPQVGQRDVEVDVAHGVAQLVGERLALVVENVADHYVCALGDKHPGMRFTHAAGTAADQCDFSIHASHDGSRYLRN